MTEARGGYRPIPWGLIGGLAVGVTLRIVLLRGPGGALDGDEALTGILARAATRGDVRWFFPGQYYQGTLEALLLVPFRAIFGDSALLVKLITVGCWLGASLLIDSATVRLRLAPRWVAFTLMWCWSAGMIRVSTDARTGYGSGLILISFGYWAWAHAVAGRPLASCGWLAVTGTALGAAIWQSPTFVGAAMAIGLGALCVRSSRTPTRLAVLAGSMLVGVMPLVIFNALHDWAGLSPPLQPPTTLWQRFDAVMTQLIPRSLGLRFFEGPWSLGGAVSKILLALIAALMAGAGVISWTGRPGIRPVVIAPVIGIATLSIFTTSWYFDDSRYAISLVPPMVILTATGITRIAGSPVAARLRVPPTGLIALTLVGWTVALAAIPGYRQGWTNDPDAVRSYQSSPQELRALGRFIRSAGYRCATGSYWVSHPLDYLSQPTVHTQPMSFFPVRFPDDASAITSAVGRYVIVAKLDELDASAIIASIDPAVWSHRRTGRYEVYLPIHPAPDRPGSLC